MKQVSNYWDIADYPEFFKTLDNLSGLQVWHLVKHIRTMCITKSVEDFTERSNCPNLHVKNSNSDKFFVLLLSKNGNGKNSLKLTVYYDEGNRLIWLLKCKILEKNPL